MDSKKAARVFCGNAGDVRLALFAALGDDAQDFRQVLRFVDARHGVQGFRREVGRVAFQHQALVRDVAHGVA